VSGIDIAEVDSLKALDPKRPIREADVGHKIEGRAKTDQEPTLCWAADSQAVTKSEFWRLGDGAQGCCAHASTVFLCWVKWAGRFVRKDAPDGTAGDWKVRFRRPE
jgi:hypothetical protein